MSWGHNKSSTQMGCDYVLGTRQRYNSDGMNVSYGSDAASTVIGLTVS